jgi:hypothetical protein
LVDDLFLWQGKLRDKFVYVVYSNGKKKRFIEGEWSNDLAGVRKWLGLKQDLEIFLTKFSPPTLMNILFFLDIRHRCKCFCLEMADVYNRKFKTNDIVDDILKDSQGFLLWHYQIENLVRLFYVEREVKEFSEGLIYKKPKYWSKAKKLRLSDGVSLHDILKDRLIVSDRTTIPPRFHFALNLFNTLGK